MKQMELQYEYEFVLPLHLQVQEDWRHKQREAVARCVTTLHRAGLKHILFSEHDVRHHCHRIIVREMGHELRSMGRGDNHEDPAQA